MTTFTALKIPGAYLVERKTLRDARGHLSRLFCRDTLAEAGIAFEPCQINTSLTVEKGALRGLHYQQPPFSEDKLVQCLSGSVYDVMVDLRRDSKTYMQVVGVELGLNNSQGLLIPKGCAHGFQTLEPHVVLHYMHSENYASSHEAGLRYSDPKLQIDWPLPITEISEKDRNWPLLTSQFEGIRL